MKLKTSLEKEKGYKSFNLPWTTQNDNYFGPKIKLLE